MYKRSFSSAVLLVSCILIGPGSQINLCKGLSNLLLLLGLKIVGWHPYRYPHWTEAGSSKLNIEHGKTNQYPKKKQRLIVWVAHRDLPTSTSQTMKPNQYPLPLKLKTEIQINFASDFTRILWDDSRGRKNGVVRCTMHLVFMNFQ